MPLSPTNTSVIRKIAELAVSHESARQRLEQILDATREALGLGALSAVAKGSAPEDLQLWHSSEKDYKLDSLFIQKEALRIIGNGKQAIHTEKHFVISLPVVNGFKSALVGFGELNDDKDSALLQIASSYVSILIEQERLAEEVESVNQQAKKSIEEIATIYEIGQAINSTDIEPLLNMIVTKAAAVMDAQTCSLMLRNQIDGALVIEASFGLADDIIKGTKISIGEGIAGKVAATGKPMLIEDVSADERLNKNVKPRPGISGSMCVPLKDEYGGVRGVLSIRRHNPKPPFNQEDLKTFSVFATHAALAISNTQLCTNLHRKVQEVCTISDVMQAINSTLDLEHVLNQIVESITRVVGFDRCCVYLLDNRTNEFIAGARKGYRADDKIRDRIKFDEGVIGIAAKERVSIFSQGSPIDSGDTGYSGEVLVAPIVVRDECIGMVVVDNCTMNQPIETQHVELLSTFVSQAGIAVENARLYEAMEEKYAELNMLYEHSRNISSAYGLDNVVEVFVHTASKAIRCDGAGLLLLDNKRDKMNLQASSGEMTQFTAHIEQLAKEARCVEFVRKLRAPALISSDSFERTGGINADLLNTLAPTESNLLIAPLVAEDTTIGVLAIYRSKYEEFQAEEFKLISIITSHAATVLKNAIIYEQKMRQRVLELSALYEFSKKISSAANLEEALTSILAIVADLVDYDESYIYAVDHERGLASVKAARFRGEPVATPQEEPLDGASVISWAINEHKALVFPDISHESKFSDLQKQGRSVRSLMSIPLIVQDEVVGVLSVHNYSPNQYSEDDVRVLSIIASQGAAIYKELEALTALTNYTDNILSSIAAGVVTLDSDGTVLTWNASAEEIVKLAAEDIVGFNYEDILSYLTVEETDRDNFRRAIMGVLDTGITYQGYKLCFHPKDRDELYMNMSISQLLNSAGERLGLVMIFEDISHDIKMENEFHRMGELAAVGQLAASIAHELRNPLSSIKGAAQFLQKEYEDHSSIVEFLGIIVEEVNGLNKLTTEFLDFARPMQLELIPICINDVVEKTLQLMSVHITDNNVVVMENLDNSVPEIQADDKQLEQVLKNMIINSLQAMPGGGVISVETGPTPAGGAYLSVSDTGIGIAKDKLDRIFQPFFTTKTKGTGLGLSVVNKIIENHGGKIEVTSQVDKGSTFKIILPRTGIYTPITAEIDQTIERRVSGELKSGDTSL